MSMCGECGRMRGLDKLMFARMDTDGKIMRVKNGQKHDYFVM
jgi:hypothetical protein